MEQEIRDGFANVLAEISKVDLGDDAREAASQSRETSAAVSQLYGKAERLESVVFGSKPPPAAAPPVMARITEGEGTVADLTGRVLALQSVVAEVRKQNEEQLVLLSGITKSVSGVLTHPLARKVAMAAALAALAWLGTVQARIEARAEKIESVIDGGGK